MQPHTDIQLTETSGDPMPMPVLFVGHGSPMNAIEDNAFSRGWRQAAQSLPRPKAILCISAHWETWGTLVTGQAWPPTIHDFGGFPPALYAARYPAPGSAWLAQTVHNIIHRPSVGMDYDWGLDHGCWSVLLQMYPQADIPVVQLSMDYTQPAQYHYELAKQLAPLRRQGVLILGSGNMVHNLRRVVFRGGGITDFNEPFGLDWAIEANELFKALINADRHQELVNYPALGPAVQLAVPTPEHYLPLLYILALKEAGEAVTYFNDQPVGGSLTMTSLVIRQEAG
jgi:4,5-DOPA dioxygenase extradiol